MYLISLLIVLTGSMIFLCTVEIYQIMVTEALGPHTWNSLPENIKSTTSLNIF